MWIQNGKLIHAQGVTNPCVYSFGKNTRIKEQGRDLGRITLLALFMPQKGNYDEEVKSRLKTLRSRLKSYRDIEITELRLEMAIDPSPSELIVFTDSGYAISKEDGELVIVDGKSDQPANFGLRNTARLLIRMGVDPSTAISFAYRTKTLVGYEFVGLSRIKRWPIKLTYRSIVSGLIKAYVPKRKIKDDSNNVSGY